MDTTVRALDIRSVIDSERFSPFQGLVVLLCFLVLAVDGYDTAAMGFVAPTLAHAWQIDRSTLGPVMSAALIGLGFGAVGAGPLADRLGRKTVMILALAFIGGWSLVSAFSQSTNELVLFRFLTGLGLGASLPNGITLASEFVPARRRGILLNIVSGGFSAGVILGGVASSWLIPHMGWPSVLITGGVMPIVLALMLLLLLPESPQFLATRTGRRNRITHILARIAPHRSFDGYTFVPEHSDGGKHSAVRVVLSRQYVMRTMMLWAGYFMVCLMYYLLVSWMPTLFKEAGFGVAFGALLTALFPLGGAVGALMGGFLIDYIGAHRTIIFSFLLAGVLAIAAGQCIGLATTLLGTLIFLCGLMITCVSTSMTTFSAVVYPTEGRATGVSWMLAFGRLGAASGAFVGATLVGMGWHVTGVFALLAGPAIAGAGAIYLIARGSDVSSASLRGAAMHH
ncbi:MFS transporter [Paraburkholderia sp. MM5384-R2]|uniref:MFS transporter n=1 Tax=Paraburkholderia sp. MM5384-R2 TaxID=2723097 RepID=UPI0016213110|nr:MFS transporter [Paraburkholderia sp. MM5384-R2]MBB5498832.1 AAHS family 4-hydroxybenzoate transporter-like MFS transporter [Paraburkholderia sp. MM5384-R2]